MAARALNVCTATAMLLLVQGCVEDDVILPGVREDIPEIAADGIDPSPADNRAVAISLPAQKANASWPQGHGTPAFRTSNAALSSALSVPARRPPS